LWTWALATFACALIAAWKKVKAPAKAVAVAVPKVAVKVTPEILTSFVNTYEEKRKILTEIKSLETAVSKGRIPRQRYKVQRKTLEIRLATVDRNLNELKGKLRSAGGRYADLMRQLEVAETEINEVEEGIRSVESRHRRGEITLEAYRKLLADYQRRKEKAETTIDGILLRLREESR
jgi:predicted  nucleic acid-binding Zn-ribbon protein